MAQTSTTMTVRLNRETQRRLERLARVTTRSKAFLAQEAIRAFVEQQEWQLGAIETGVADADADRFVAHDSVEPWLRSWGATREKKRP